MHRGKRRSVLQERRIAEDIGGRVQPGSGAPAFYKSDAVAGLDLRVEAKTTSKASYSLTTSVLDKIRNEALSGGQEDWAMQIEFQGQFTHKRVAVIDWDRFLDLMKTSKEHKTCGTKPDEALSKEDCG
jgi:hypothetical protein